MTLEVQGGTHSCSCTFYMNQPLIFRDSSALARHPFPWARRPGTKPWSSARSLQRRHLEAEISHIFTTQKPGCIFVLFKICQRNFFFLLNFLQKYIEKVNTILPCKLRKGKSTLGVAFLRHYSRGNMRVCLNTVWQPRGDGTQYFSPQPLPPPPAGSHARVSFSLKPDLKQVKGLHE